jgi:hypothetical protein
MSTGGDMMVGAEAISQHTRAVRVLETLNALIDEDDALSSALLYNTTGIRFESSSHVGAEDKLPTSLAQDLSLLAVLSMIGNTSEALQYATNSFNDLMYTHGAFRAGGRLEVACAKDSGDPVPTAKAHLGNFLLPAISSLHSASKNIDFGNISIADLVFNEGCDGEERPAQPEPCALQGALVIVEEYAERIAIQLKYRQQLRIRLFGEELPASPVAVPAPSKNAESNKVKPSSGYQPKATAKAKAPPRKP